MDENPFVRLRPGGLGGFCPGSTSFKQIDQSFMSGGLGVPLSAMKFAAAGGCSRRTCESSSEVPGSTGPAFAQGWSPDVRSIGRRARPRTAATWTVARDHGLPPAEINDSIVDAFQRTIRFPIAMSGFGTSP